MLSLAERVDRSILRYSLLPPGARVVVALSGGADSTALACLLVELAARHGFVVVAAAHFNHGLRPAAEEDEAFCRRLAARHGLGWIRGAQDVRSFAAREGASLEDAGRRLRYAFLRRAALEHRASHVAVGHTRDDQAETVLLRMVRGAGPRGLGGMLPSRPLGENGNPRRRCAEEPSLWLVRPLLEVGHEELVAWLAERGQVFREDESNRDLRFVRNRVRHELIPFLRARVSASIMDVLARNAEIAASDAAFMDELAGQAYASIVVDEGDDRVELDRMSLAAQPAAIRGRVVLMALRNILAGRFVGRDQVDRVVALADGRLNGPLALPGGVASGSGGRVVVERAPRPAPVNFSPAPLSIPGEARVAGSVVSSFLRPWDGTADAASLRETRAVEAVVDASRVSRLTVRTRRAGDWLRPLGMAGRTKKLQDFFVDRKVPRDARDRVPLVVDEHDRIVWVGGHGIDDEFRVREGTHDVVILRMRGDSA